MVENADNGAVRRCGSQCPIDRLLEGAPDEVCLQPDSPLYLLAQCVVVGVEAAKGHLKDFRRASREEVEEAIQQAIATRTGLISIDEHQFIAACVLKARDPDSDCTYPRKASAPAQPKPHSSGESDAYVAEWHELVRRRSLNPWA